MFKRGKIYWCKIQHEGKVIQRSLETRDKKMAKRIEAIIREDLISGKYFEKQIGTDKIFKEVMEKYLKEVSAHKALRSAKTDLQRYKNHLAPYFDDMQLIAIKKSHISDYQAQRLAEGASGATVNRELALLKHVFNIAIDPWEWTSYNPLSKFKMMDEPDREEFMREEQFNSIYAL